MTTQISKHQNLLLLLGFVSIVEDFLLIHQFLLELVGRTLIPMINDSDGGPAILERDIRENL